MDRNSITWLVLIGLILTVFSIINKPTAEDYKKKAKIEESKTITEESKKKTSQSKNTGNDTPEIRVSNDLKTVEKGEITRLENEKLVVDFNSKGGIIAAVYLKDYKSYADFSKNKDQALCLFKDGDAHNQLIFPLKNKKIYTKNYLFNISQQSKNKM